jgi:hypothetical protein
MNRLLPLLSEAQAAKIGLANNLIVEQCMDGATAIDTSCVVSGYSKESLAELIGKPREILSRACSGRGGLDIDVLIRLMRESGNALIVQYMAKQIGGEFRFLTQEELAIKKAEQELAELKARRRA